MNPVELRNFVSVKSCCLSTKGLSLLNKVRGGQMDPCCMTKHVSARTVSDLMSEVYVQDTWYKVTINFEGVYEGSISWEYWTVTNKNGDVIKHGRVPNGQPSYPLPAILSTPLHGFELAQQLVELINQGSSDPMNLQVSAFNTTPISPAQTKMSFQVVLYVNENYLDVNDVLADLNFTFQATNLEYSIKSSSIETSTERVYPCLTSANMCDFAGYLNSYCDSCDEYKPEPVI